MSNSIEELYDYDLVEKCCRCKNILLKTNFHKDNKRKDGVQRICIICIKQYHNNHKEQRNAHKRQKRKTDFNFILFCNIRVRTNKAFNLKMLKKTNKTIILLGCSLEFSKKWILNQLYGEMTLENYGKIWCLDHCYPLSITNLSNENDIYKSTNWINLRPMYIKDNIAKGDKIDQRIYLMQEIKAYQFIKLNEKRPNEDIRQ